MSRKILISRSFGAGWSTWAGDSPSQSDSLARRALTYQPIIDAIESGDWLDTAKRKALHAQAKEELDDIYMGGFDDLEIAEVDGPFCVEEYDGSESIRTTSDFFSIDAEG